MLLYAATYPRCGSGVLRRLLALNFNLVTDSDWDANPGDRAALAASDQLHCVKTHAPPPPDPLDGERAIQLIRHPAPAIASHYRLHLANKGRERPLKRFIAGQRKTGDWTSYHRAWAQTSMPFLRLRFEDVTVDPAPAVRAIAGFIGLPEPSEIAAETLEEAHRRNPSRNPAAAPEAWRDLIFGKELKQLRETHGELAAEWDYSLD